MPETLTKAAKSQDSERAQEKKRRLEPAPGPVKALADESVPFEGFLGVSAMEIPLENHAAFMGDPRFFHPANNAQKARMVTQLQATYGNQYVQRLAESLNVQAKLIVGSPNDQYERKADRVANAVIGASTPSIQRRVEEEEEKGEEIQAKPIAKQIGSLARRQVDTQNRRVQIVKGLTRIGATIQRQQNPPVPVRTFLRYVTFPNRSLAQIRGELRQLQNQHQLGRMTIMTVQPPEHARNLPIARAIRHAILEIVRNPPNSWINSIFHVRVPLRPSGPLREYAPVRCACDNQRNVSASYDGTILGAARSALPGRTFFRYIAFPNDTLAQIQGRLNQLRNQRGRDGRNRLGRVTIMTVQPPEHARNLPIARAIRHAIHAIVRNPPNSWANSMFHVRVPLQRAGAIRYYANVMCASDNQRNVTASCNVTSSLATPPTRVKMAGLDIGFPPYSEQRLRQLIRTEGPRQGLGQRRDFDMPTGNSDRAKKRRRAVLYAVYKAIDQPGGTGAFWNHELRLRVPLQPTSALQSYHYYGLILLRFDNRGNLKASYVGTDKQTSRLLHHVGATATTRSADMFNNEAAARRYSIKFADNNLTLLAGTPILGIVLPNDEPLTGKQWADPEVKLVESVLELLGARDRDMIKGMTLRRLSGTDWAPPGSNMRAAGLYNPTDNSINFWDAALPVQRLLWYRDRRRVLGRGAHTVMHEIGHALEQQRAHQRQGAAVPPASLLNRFRTIVVQEARRRHAVVPPNQFPFPPPQIDFPTDYASESWNEFFAESYAIYRTNRAFFNTPRYIYLLNFFARNLP